MSPDFIVTPCILRMKNSCPLRRKNLSGIMVGVKKDISVLSERLKEERGLKTDLEETGGMGIYNHWLSKVRHVYIYVHVYIFIYCEALEGPILTRVLHNLTTLIQKRYILLRTAVLYNGINSVQL